MNIKRKILSAIFSLISMCLRAKQYQAPQTINVSGQSVTIQNNINSTNEFLAKTFLEGRQP